MGELKDHARDAEVYLGLGYRGPTSNNLRIFVFKSTQIMGLQQSLRERFGRGSLSADPRLVDGAVSSSSERRKMMERVEELSVHLSGWLCSWCRA
jgi:hypothetical protein